MGSRTSSQDSRSTGAAVTAAAISHSSPGGSSSDTLAARDDYGTEREREWQGQGQQQLIRPVEPKGSSVLTSKYAGRALAEWSMVVSECNTFVDRRRDEGILGLRDVEVPTLGSRGPPSACIMRHSFFFTKFLG